VRNEWFFLCMVRDCGGVSSSSTSYSSHMPSMHISAFVPYSLNLTILTSTSLGLAPYTSARTSLIVEPVYVPLLPVYVHVFPVFVSFPSSRVIVLMLAMLSHLIVV